MPENNKAMISSSSSLPVPVRGNGTSTSYQATGHRTPASHEDTRATPAETRLKMQLDDCERRRKNLVTQTQKVTRENENLQRKYKQIVSEQDVLKKNYESTTQELLQLKRVSEAVYKEYETLSRRFNVETGAMHKAMEKASDWYKQNRVLKRRSAILVQKFLQVSPDSIAELDENSTTETPDKDGDELDDLRRSVKELSSESARLQVELNAARLEEFEAQEQLIETTTKLENEKTRRLVAEEELAEHKARNNALGRLASLEAEELATLRDKIEQDKNATIELRKEADKAKKERNVLAHQSTLLLADIVGDQRMQMLVFEVESLKSKLEDENNKHNNQMQELQNKIFELQSENKVETLEEKLKLIETELEGEQQRAARAESKVKELESKVMNFEERTVKHKIDNSNIPGVPSAPPPPPLPPPPPAFRDVSPGQHPVHEMANMLGLKSTKTEAKLQKTASLQGGAIDEIIEQIKGGRFTLKSAGKQQKGNQDEQPAAVQEMLHILGTMKRGTSRKPFTPV